VALLEAAALLAAMPAGSELELIVIPVCGGRSGVETSSEQGSRGLADGPE
jgi:hypothetical protein